jgi:hypothetical protein
MVIQSPPKPCITISRDLPRLPHPRRSRPPHQPLLRLRPKEHLRLHSNPTRTPTRIRTLNLRRRRRLYIRLLHLRPPLQTHPRPRRLHQRLRRRPLILHPLLRHPLPRRQSLRRLLLNLRRLQLRRIQAHLLLVDPVLARRSRTPPTMLTILANQPLK